MNVVAAKAVDDMAKPATRDPSTTWRARLTEFGIRSLDEYAGQAFARNFGLVTEKEQRRLGDATMAIPGMGGVGGAHLATACRVGFGGFHLADFDQFEVVNINRQYGARVPTLGRPKIDVMMEEASAINPFLRLTPFRDGIDSASLDSFLDGVDVVIDSLDFFAIDVRRSLFNRARNRGIPVVTAGPLGFSSVMLVFHPTRGMSFDEYFDLHDGLPEREKLLRFMAGLAPQPTHLGYTDMTKIKLEDKAGPSSAIACMLCAGVAVMEAVRIVLGRPGMRPAPRYAQFDPYVGRYRRGKLRGGNRNAIQRAKLAVLRAKLLRKIS